MNRILKDIVKHAALKDYDVWCTVEEFKVTRNPLYLETAILIAKQNYSLELAAKIEYFLTSEHTCQSCGELSRQVNYADMCERCFYEEVTLLNYTPHDVVLLSDKNKVIEIIKSSGVARCKETKDKIDEFYIKGHMININKKEFTEVEGLPPQEEGVLIIVSNIVISAMKGERGDLIAPDDVVRDDGGKIIGCKSFSK